MKLQGVANVCYRYRKDSLSCAAAAQLPVSPQDTTPGVAPVGAEPWRGSTSCRRAPQGSCFTLRSLCVGTELLGSHVKGYGRPRCPHGGCSARAVAGALGLQWWGNSRNLILNCLNAPVQRFEGCTLVLKQCSEIRGMVKCASSSHLERGLWAVGESPRLVLSLLTAGQHRQATSTAHQLSDSDVLRSSNPSTGLLWSTISAGHASSCFFSVLGDAGTEPAQHRESGSPVSCLLLGWLLNSCFSYDITAFKLQKKSISELKTYRLFHKKERARC